MDTDKYFYLHYKLLRKARIFNFLSSIAPLLVSVKGFTQSSSEWRGKGENEITMNKLLISLIISLTQKSLKHRCNFRHINSAMTPMEIAPRSARVEGFL